MRFVSALLLALLAAQSFSRAIGDDEKSAVQEGVDASKKPAPQPAVDPRFDRETPEGTLRLLTLGVMLGDEELIKLSAIPESDDEMKLLYKKPEGSPLNAKQMKEMCANMKVRTLKVGDKFTLPGNKEVVVGKQEVTDDRMVLVSENAPVPTRMEKIDGHWWVDVRPLIAARKAAAGAQAKEAKDGQEGKAAGAK